MFEAVEEELRQKDFHKACRDIRRKLADLARFGSIQGHSVQDLKLWTYDLKGRNTNTSQAYASTSNNVGKPNYSFMYAGNANARNFSIVPLIYSQLYPSLYSSQWCQ